MSYFTAALMAFQTIGQIAQGQAASKQAAFQAGVAQQQAERAEQQAKLDEYRVRRKTSADLASARARFGASGINPSSGSALLVLEGGAGDGEVDALAARSNALNRSAQFRSDATLSLMRGRAAGQRAFFSIGTSLLRDGRAIAASA